MVDYNFWSSSAFITVPKMKDVSFSLLTQTSYWNNAFFATPHRYEWISLVSKNNDAFILSYNTLTIGLTRIRYYFYNILFCPKITTSNIFKISEKNMYIAEHRKLVIVPRNVHTVSRISSYNTSKNTTLCITILFWCGEK